MLPRRNRGQPRGHKTRKRKERSSRITRARGEFSILLLVRLPSQSFTYCFPRFMPNMPGAYFLRTRYGVLVQSWSTTSTEIERHAIRQIVKSRFSLSRRGIQSKTKCRCTDQSMSQLNHIASQSINQSIFFLSRPVSRPRQCLVSSRLVTPGLSAIESSHHAAS